ncbi:MAG TPA: pitrilysin family protein [Ferruginibacter sp.]|nr:pitrilysin family protein [Ferruginibacter sp.]HRO05262.1 pitrilysin family protein [Ferruginibacter sp.]HRO96025.1 pitrilysin family protein [Ferruginibacter sp.]HRP48642.1 pitrilysin family protein [Ferruginibacter sp.]
MMRVKLLFFGLCFAGIAHAQKVDFTEYDLKNGLHVVLHQDKSAPVVAVSVMYHVGSKDENPERTGFAHFFEHLLFEGSKNIKRGEFMKIVSSNGGQNNANTTQDRTFYYELFPSNQLETGLWLESERMLHPVINEEGVKTQNEVVKEEKRMRIDNQPYGNLISEIMVRIFKNHPYRWAPIGSMEHLDAAKLDEFLAFFKKFYAPNNAVLVIAGDIDIDKTKKLVDDYFSEIPKGEPLVRNFPQEEPITTEIVDTAYDVNVQIPALVLAYRTPGMTSKESMALQFASDVLSQGASSRMYKKMVDDKKNALFVGSFNYALEDHGIYICFTLPSGEQNLDSMVHDMSVEIKRLQDELISEEEFTKIMNQFENNFVGTNAKMLGVAENLANGYTFYRNTNYINQELEQARKVTRQDIQNVARKYLNPNQRVRLYYMPKKD